MSRVGGDDFIENRYSLDSDTIDFGTILFAGNAPTGTKLLKVKLDPNEITASAKFLHVATTSNGISFQQTAMYSLFNGVYEAFLYVKPGQSQYQFYNETTLSDAETVGSCANSLENRATNVVADIVVACNS